MSQSGKVAPLAAAVSLVVLGAIVAGVVLLDPPGVQRQRKLDQRRAGDLNTISLAIDEYWRRHANTLPHDLAVLSVEPGLRVDLSDPESKLPYGYEVQDARAYRLCAVFAGDSGQQPRSFNGGPGAWAHGQGRHCFSLKPPKPDRQ